MATSRDRRPSDYDIPSTDDVLRRLRKGRGKTVKSHHVVVGDESGLTPEQQNHAVDPKRPHSTKVLIWKDWILVGLVSLTLTLQVCHMIEERDDNSNTSQGEQNRPPETASAEEEGVASGGPADSQHGHDEGQGTED